MTYFVNQTKSYTLAVNAETGEWKLEVSDELKENLKDMVAEADTTTEAAAGFLDILGEDELAFVEAMDAILDMDGALSAAHGAGGIEAMDAVIADHAANNSLAGNLADRLAEKEGFAGFGTSFVEVPSNDIGDYLDWGMPSDGGDVDPSTFSPTYGLTQDSGDDATGFVVKVVGATIGGGLGGAITGGAVTAAATGGAGAFWGAVVGGALGAGGGLYWAVTDEAEKVDDTINGHLDGAFIPADPNAEYEGLVDFTPPWVEAQLTEGATYGLILTDPNSEKGVEGTKEFDPDAELDGLILTNPDDVKTAVKAEQVQEAAEFHLTTTTQPPADGFQFKPDFGNDPDLGGGEAFQAGDEGIIYITHGDGGIIANPMAAVMEPAPEAAEVQVEEPMAVDHFEFM